MLHIFYLKIINILTHVFVIRKKEGGIKEGIHKNKKMPNFLICEIPKKKERKGKQGFFKVFLNSVNKLETICLYNWNATVIHLNIKYLKLHTLSIFWLQVFILESYLFHIFFIMTQRDFESFPLDLTHKLLEHFSFLLIIIFCRITVDFILSLLLILSPQNSVICYRQKDKIYTKENLSIFFIHMIFLPYIFTYFPWLLLIPNSPETPRNGAVLFGYVIFDIFSRDW